mgnify:CR=1 FL=1
MSLFRNNTIIYQNVRDLNSKVQEFYNICCDTDGDIVLLSET